MYLMYPTYVGICLHVVVGRGPLHQYRVEASGNRGYLKFDFFERETIYLSTANRF